MLLVQLLAGTDDDLSAGSRARFGHGIADRALFLGADLGTLTQLLQMNTDHGRGACATLRRIAVNLSYTSVSFRKS